MTPPLTTVRQPADEMGVAAAAAMIQLIAGEDIELPKLKSELVRRDSTQEMA